MHHPHNFVVVGDNKETPAKFFTKLEPVKLKQNVGMAITSIFHGSILNITSENQNIIFEVNIHKLVDIEKVTSSTTDIVTSPTTDIVEGLNILVPDTVEGLTTIEIERESFKIDVGNYGSTLSILKTISVEFEEQFPGNDYDFDNTGRRRKKPRLIKTDKPLRLEIDDRLLDHNKEGFIKVTPKNMTLVIEKNTPWNLIGYNFSAVSENTTFQVRNVNYSKTIQPAFLYSNIIENSYINGKLSRNLSTIPLNMNSGWNFYEFKNPIYVPIDVKEFSKILLDLRDMNGKPIQFDPSFKTILNLNIKPINRSDINNQQLKENGAV